MKPVLIKDLFPKVNTPRFNFGAWIDSSSNHTMLIGREVIAPAPYHLPAIGNLVQFEWDGDKILSERVLWIPKDKTSLLEDTRIVKFGDKLNIGLTAVERIEGDWTAFPAVKITLESDLSFDNTQTIKEFGPGKNTTTLDENTWFFRPSDSFFNHKLLVFNYENQVATKTGEIVLPETFDWARFKFGSSIPPVWLDDAHALFLVHGITYLHGIYVYTLGRGILTRSGDKFEAKIHPEPLITPDTFAHLGIEELNPEDRRVVYCCGGVIREEVLLLYVNIGDHKTCEIGYNLKELANV